jgi:hypothetical protein
LVPLYLDGLEYYAIGGTGPAGPAYSSNIGMKIPADEGVVVKMAWEVPEFAVQLRVLTPTGRPRPGVDVYGNWRTNTCGGADRIAQTDATGTVRLDLDATFTALTLMIGGPYSAGDPEGNKNTRELTATELRELFSKDKLTIRWWRALAAAKRRPQARAESASWTAFMVVGIHLTHRKAQADYAEQSGTGRSRGTVSRPGMRHSPAFGIVVETCAGGAIWLRGVDAG